VTIGELLGALHDDRLLIADPRVPAAVRDREATAVVYDSRQAVPGCVFVALHGQQADGSAFAPQAVSRGAAIVVSEGSPRPDVDAPWLVVPDARLALALLADRFHGSPSQALQLVGITGTNGKTTSAYLLKSVFEAAGHRCGLLGTVSYNLGTEERPATRTTPEAPDLQAMLREMTAHGCTAAVMEVSSHALALKRVDGVQFAAGVFTNLTRDHLDFHRDMEDYAAAKRRLFQLLGAETPAVVNADDPRAGSFVAAARRPVTFGVRRPADVTAADVSLTLEGLAFEVQSPAGTLSIRSALVGRPNVYNILGVVATATALGIPREAIERGIAALQGVPGRFELASGGLDDITVIVDYAHTDDALRNLLETARSLSPGRLVTVFGCGGDRDRTKRPLMAAVAGRMSEVVVVTSDNPRSEDPARIIEEILRGMPASSEHILPLGGSVQRIVGPEVLTIVDRRAAIDRAVELAQPGDVVIVAGKGHEQTQTIGARTLAFDDVAVARAALVRRRAKQRVV
jgi:UDP-N-acetylmuramoyl-L-alanyl-D-glutamate--2,6-diaminopimelate ligase